MKQFFLLISISSFGVKEYNTARIIEKMNSVIKKRLDDEKTDTAIKYSESEIKWIWENRQILVNINEKIKIYIITRNGNVRLSDELYFGKEYGNYICERLYDGLFEDRFINLKFK